MEKWITGKDIVRNGILSEATLIMQFAPGTLLGYKLDDDMKPIPIDPQREKQIFNAVQNLCNPEYCSKFVEEKNPNYQNPYTTRRWDRPPEQPMRITEKKVALYRFATGLESKWVPWEKLFQYLSNAGPMEHWPIVCIPPSQELAIRQGWNDARILELAFSAYFKEEEIKAISGQASEHQQIPPPSIHAKEESQYLRPEHRTRIEGWKAISQAAGRDKKTIERAEKTVKMPAVVHREGNKVWAHKDELKGLIDRYDNYKERKTKEKRAANKVK